jgi:UDP-N-acetylglucosamine--N-acetylmuramyl-(pentapeptide) pyrophosphoryl-undecaprenol N-acetylglucosamine transferase
LVIGGSLGARTINTTFYNSWEQLTNAGYNLIWQKGNNFPQADQLTHSNLVVRNFIYEMDLAYAAADIVVSRAGALSIAEIAIVQKPVILVPSPNVAEDHQTKNAMALVNENAALIVKDNAANTDLIPEILALLNNTQNQALLAKQIEKFAKPNAAIEIAKEALQLVQ